MRLTTPSPLHISPADAVVMQLCIAQRSLCGSWSSQGHHLLSPTPAFPTVPFSSQNSPSLSRRYQSSLLLTSGAVASGEIMEHHSYKQISCALLLVSLTRPLTVCPKLPLTRGPFLLAGLSYLEDRLQVLKCQSTLCRLATVIPEL